MDVWRVAAWFLVLVVFASAGVMIFAGVSIARAGIGILAVVWRRGWPNDPAWARVMTQSLFKTGVAVLTWWAVVVACAWWVMPRPGARLDLGYFAVAMVVLALGALRVRRVVRGLGALVEEHRRARADKQP